MLRIRYAILFLVLLIAEVIIGVCAKGVVRGYVGDSLIIPTIYFLLRALFFTKDGIFSVYVLPFICYSMGWAAEVLQAFDITIKLGIEKESLLGIVIGGYFDLKDGVMYLLGLYIIGVYLALESREKNDRQWWYPIAVFLHWTWGNAQTMIGLCMYLIYFSCPHRYYRGVVQTIWPLKSGLSLGMFIFTPIEDSKESDENEWKEYCDEITVHEYGHTFQALLLGPLYLIVIGIPSITWELIPAFRKLRDEKNYPYTWLFCEKWASFWGEKITKEKAYWR